MALVIPGPCRVCGSRGTVRRGGEWKAGDYVNGAEYTCPRCAARTALAFLLTRIGSWTNATWDQHVRNEYGDEAADALHVILDEANIPIVAFQSSKVQPVKQSGGMQVAMAFAEGPEFSGGLDAEPEDI